MPEKPREVCPADSYRNWADPEEKETHPEATSTAPGRFSPNPEGSFVASSSPELEVEWQWENAHSTAQCPCSRTAAPAPAHWGKFPRRPTVRSRDFDRRSRQANHRRGQSLLAPQSAWLANRQIRHAAGFRRGVR